MGRPALHYYKTVRLLGVVPDTVPRPTITSVSPNTGLPTGGTPVTVTGTGFEYPTTKLAAYFVSRVLFNGVDATNVVVTSPTTLTCVTPAGPSGPVAVRVLGPGGQDVKANGFTYANPAPTLSSANYTLGDTAGGGQSIVLTGTNLSSVTTVTIGGNPVSPSGTTSTTCTFTLPAHASGAVSVTVTSPNGTSNPLTFTYWSPTQIAGIDCYLDSSKGVTTSSGSVTQWNDQSATANVFSQGTGADQPTLVSNVFGTMPSIRFTPQQWVIGTNRSFSAGQSYFAVAAWTSSRSVETQTGINPPLTLIGSSTGLTWGSFGASAGHVCLTQYTGIWDKHVDGGAGGLNSGSPFLFGATEDTSGNVKFYSGTTQLGTTQSTTWSSSDNYDTIGVGYTDVDGWAGDVGAAIVVQGIISGSDQANLYAWAQQRFGVA